MIFETLKVNNLMGCDYEIEFSPRYTVIIGNNRQGKTLTARLIMLALYGTGRMEKELHDSWKLRTEELLPTSDEGHVELVFSAGERRYKIYREFDRRTKVEFYVEKEGSWRLEYRKDADVKTGLEEEVGITPGLMNVVMSNEQSLIGAISYDDRLQASVWAGWKWKSEIIRGNIKKARDKCAKEASRLRGDIEHLNDTVESILIKWVEKGIFSETKAKEPVSEKTLEAKLDSIKSEEKITRQKHKHYSEFHSKLIKLDDLESKRVISEITKICKEKREFLDEKADVRTLIAECANYSKTLANILGKGGEEGIKNRIRDLEDEIKKLKAARGLKDRKTKPLKTDCDIYPPSDRENLVVQIPDEMASKFKYEEIASGGIAVPYDEDKERAIGKEKQGLERLLKKFDGEKGNVKNAKDGLRDRAGAKAEQLQSKMRQLGEQKTVLESDKDRYLESIKNVAEKTALAERLETAKKWFTKLHAALSEEESLKKIRKETVAFINRIYEKVYGWDINAKMEDGDKIIVTDAQGNVRSHPSGSETHIMGLAWRWMVARGFDLPLVLDELDILLDGKNLEKTRRLIQEEMDRQTVILTLKEDLKDLPGKIYRVVREEGVTTMEHDK